MSEAQRTAITNDVKRTLSATADSIAAKGFTGWIPFFHKSPDFAWEFYDNSTSYDTLVLQIMHLAPLFRSVTFQWDSVQVQVLTENEASVIANSLETCVDTAGKSLQLSGMIKCTLLKVGDSWKFVKVHTE